MISTLVQGIKHFTLIFISGLASSNLTHFQRPHTIFFSYKNKDNSPKNIIYELLKISRVHINIIGIPWILPMQK